MDKLKFKILKEIEFQNIDNPYLEDKVKFRFIKEESLFDPKTNRRYPVEWRIEDCQELNEDGTENWTTLATSYDDDWNTGLRRFEDKDIAKKWFGLVFKKIKELWEIEEKNILVKEINNEK